MDKFEVSYEELVDIKTEGYKLGIRMAFKELVQYAFSSHSCSKIYRICPEAFVKYGKTKNKENN